MKKVILFIAVAFSIIISCKMNQNKTGKIESITFMLPDTHTSRDVVHMSFYTLIKTKSGDLKLLNAMRPRDTSDFNVDTLIKQGVNATYFISLNGDTVMRALPYTGEKVGDIITVEPSRTKELSDPLW